MAAINSDKWLNHLESKQIPRLYSCISEKHQTYNTNFPKNNSKDLKRIH